jgi:integrase/recombinase XerD
VIDDRTLFPVPVQQSSPLSMVVMGFLLRYPENTRAIYRSHLTQWLTWCQHNHLDPLAVQRGHIEAWGRWLTEHRKLKTSTVLSKLNCICGMYRFAHLDGYLPADPGAHVRRPRVQFISSTNGLTRAQLADLLRLAEADGPTTYAMVCLLALNGLRIGECLATDVEHLGFERGYRTIHLPHRKGGKVGTLSIAIRTAYALDRALGDRQTGPLLVGRDGTRLKVAAARRTVRRLCRQAGITKRITPHSFRHAFVTLALDAGVPERDIVASTGHSSSAMVAYYDRNRGAIERNATHAVAAFVGVAS